MRSIKRLASRGSSISVDEESMSWNGSAHSDDDSFEFLREARGANPGEDLAKICMAFERDVKVKRQRPKKYLLGYRGGRAFVFTGHDAVSFLVDRGYANSRGEALATGRRMACEFALFHHESDDFELEDEKNLFYKFTPPSQRVTNPRNGATLDVIADAFEEGVVAGTNVYRSKSYARTFTGTDAVDFLVSSTLAKSRQDAVRIGKLIMENQGAFEHVTKKHTFKDKHLLYRFVPQKQRVPKCLPVVTETIEETAQHFIDAVMPGTTFSGAHAVDVLIRGGMAPTRSDAVLLGEKLAADLKLFHCVTEREKSFFDRRDVYYQYKEEHSPSSSSQWWDDKVFCDHPHDKDDLENVEKSVCLDQKQLSISDRVKDEDQCTATKETSTAPVKSETHHGMSLEFSEDSSGHEYFISFESENGTPAGKECPALRDESSLNGSRYFDKFGFIIDCASSTSQDGNDTVGTTEEELSIGDWRALLDNCATQRGSLPHQVRANVKRMMRNGLPDSLRRQAWTTITGVDIIVRESEGEYQSFVETATLFMDDESNQGGQSLKNVIAKDLRRTFPRHCFFAEAETVSSDENSVPDGLASLRRILYAYSIYDNEVGYCQGMNFLGGMFLTLQLSEEESFWLLVAVMSNELHRMRELFTEDMSGVHEALYIADCLVERFLPKLNKHFAKEGVNISMFATQWVMTIFTSTFPFDLVARVWDSYLVEGRKVVFRVLLSLLESAQHDIIGLDMENILAYLRDLLPSKINGQSIMRASLKIPLKQKHIRKYTNEWRMGKKHRRQRQSIFEESFDSGLSIKSAKHTIVRIDKHAARMQLSSKRSTL